MDFETFVKCASSDGLMNVTSAEYEEHVKGKLWSPTTAMRMIKNARVMAEREAGKVKETLIGYPLGGGDFTYKGVSLEGSKMQKIAFLTDGGIVELSQFGHYPGKHGVETELVVEVSESEAPNGVVYTNRTIRELRGMTDRTVGVGRLMENARHFSEIGQDALYNYVVMWGRITKVEENALFADGVKSGTYPFVHDNKPSMCLVFQRTGMYVRASVGPARLSVPVVELSDGMQVLQTLNPDVVNGAFVGLPVIVVGRVRKVDIQERGDFITIAATMVVQMDDGVVPPEPEGGSCERTNPQTRWEIPAVGESHTPVESTPGDAVPPSARAAERVQELIEKLREKVIEGKELLGDDFSTQGLYDLGLIPGNVPIQTVERLVKELEK